MVSDEISLVKPTIEDIAYIAEHLRAIDVREFADTGDDARRSLLEAFDAGEVVCIARIGAEPMAAFCVAKNPTEITALTSKRFCWLKGTDRIAETGVGGLRKAMYNVHKVIQAYGHLFTFVRDDNKTATRWIQALGFKTNGGKAVFNGHPATYWERMC